jgi:hypothetical protein
MSSRDQGQAGPAGVSKAADAADAATPATEGKEARRRPLAAILAVSAAVALLCIPCCYAPASRIRPEPGDAEQQPDRGTVPPAQEDTAEPPRPATEEAAGFAVPARVWIPESKLTYKSKAGGWQITFPEHWRGWLVVTEYNGGDAVIGFYGKSHTGQNGTRDHWGRVGLDLFWIVTEPVPDMGTFKIGEANGVDYFFMQFHAPASVLKEVLDPDDSWRGYAERELGFVFDEEELALVAIDNEKFIRMAYEDLRYEETKFLKTFKPIE